VAYAENFRAGTKCRHNRVTSQIKFKGSAEGTTILRGFGHPRHEHQLRRCIFMVFATSILLGTSLLHKLSSWCFSSRSLL